VDGKTADSAARVTAMEIKLVRLGENIRRARYRLRISQEELAERSGLHRTYLSDVERGRRNLSFFSLLAIARGLGTTVPTLARNLDPDLGSPKPPAGNRDDIP
jgi:transcriptional regulator with XRE-family HTH domain